MRSLFSYLFPITKKIKTENNGVVEVTFNNGKKILDSANANYSYGSQQRILNFALKKIDFSRVSNVLLLGLGGGSVVASLRKDFDYKGKITAVEFDNKIIDIALHEFGMDQDKNLEIVNADALEYVKIGDQMFNLIIVDLYIDNIVPAIFYSISFWKDLKKHLKTKKYFIFNACIYNENSDKQMSDLLNYMRISNTIQLFNKVEDTNTVIIGTKN